MMIKYARLKVLNDSIFKLCISKTGSRLAAKILIIEIDKLFTEILNCLNERKILKNDILIL